MLNGKKTSLGANITRISPSTLPFIKTTNNISTRNRFKVYNFWNKMDNNSCIYGFKAIFEHQFVLSRKSIHTRLEIRRSQVRPRLPGWGRKIRCPDYSLWERPLLSLKRDEKLCTFTFFFNSHKFWHFFQVLENWQYYKYQSPKPMY